MLASSKNIAFLAVLALSLLACARSDEPSFHARGGRVSEPASERAQGERPGHEATYAQAAPTHATDRSPAPPGSAPELEARPTPPALLSPASVAEHAPPRFTVLFDTTKGEVRLHVTRAWAPNGADRFYSLVRAGYFTNVAFFRAIEGFMVQAGIHGDPAVNTAWRSASIPDDPVVEHNRRAMVSYAMAGPGTRTTQFFINLVDNSASLDAMGFAPFAEVDAASMAVVDRLYTGYGEGAPSGRGPAQARIQREGNTYLRAEFPLLDYIRSARIGD